MPGKNKDNKFNPLAPFTDETSKLNGSKFGDSQIAVRVTKEFRDSCKTKADEERKSFNEWIRTAMDERLHYGSCESIIREFNNLKNEFEKYKDTHPETENIHEILNDHAAEIAELRKKLDDLQNKFTTILYNKIIND